MTPDMTVSAVVLEATNTAGESAMDFDYGDSSGSQDTYHQQGEDVDEPPPFEYAGRDHLESSGGNTSAETSRCTKCRGQYTATDEEAVDIHGNRLGVHTMHVCQHRRQRHGADSKVFCTSVAQGHDGMVREGRYFCERHRCVRCWDVMHSRNVLQESVA